LRGDVSVGVRDTGVSGGVSAGGGVGQEGSGRVEPRPPPARGLARAPAL